MKEKPCVITTFNSIGNDKSFPIAKNMNFTINWSERVAYKLVLMQ